MRVGAFFRAAFGPLEKTATEFYRGLFVDLDGFAARLREMRGARRILEVGCGEGMLTQRLVERNPEAEVVGIDISDRVGRLYRGERARVTFRRQPIDDFAGAHREAFDMAVVCDVIHHVPWAEHQRFVAAIAPTIRAGGLLVLKDWEPWPSVAHLCCYLTCRYLTGDRVRYPTMADLRGVATSALAGGKVIGEFRAPGSRHNIAVVLEK